MFSLSSSSWEGSCRCARPPSVLPQVAQVSTSTSPPAAAQSRAQGSPGPARQGREPRGARPLSVSPPGACWSGLTPQTPLTCWPWASGPPALGHVHTLTPHKGKQMSPVGASSSLLHAGVFQKLSQKRGVCTLWEPPHSLFSMIKVNFQIFNSTWPGT